VDANTNWIPLIIAVLVLWAVIDIIRRRLRRRALMAKYGDKRIIDAILRKEVWQGMSQEMLVDSRGAPEDQDETIYKTKTKRTYKYGRTGKNRFRERIYIENGSVVGWKD
jgi:hypothetical protein